MNWNTPSREEWIALIQKQRKGADPSPLLFRKTLNDLPLHTLYTESQIHKMAFSPTPWVRCQSYNRMNAQRLNADMLCDLEGGSNGVWLKLDTGTNDIPNGDGACLWNLAQWDQTLSGIYLEAIPFHLAGSFADILSLLSVVHERNIEPKLLGLGMDPCGMFAKRGCLPSSFPKIHELAHKIYAYTKKRNINARCYLIDTSPYHNAGSLDRTELAIMLATGAEYLRNSGLSSQELSEQLVVSLCVGRSIPENIAKLRAARLLMEALFRACGIENHIPYIHAHTSERMMSIYDPWTNMLRTTHASFCAAVAKVDCLSIQPYDLRLQQHSELGRRVARNTHNILAEECGLAIPEDVVQGSHLFEEETQVLMKQAWMDFQKIEAEGGIVHKLQDGSLHHRIQQEYNKRKSWISSGKIAILGTSHFPQEEETPSITQPDTKAEQQKIASYMLARGEGPTIGGMAISNYLSQLRAGATRFEIDQGLFFLQEIRGKAFSSTPDALPFEELRSLPSKTLPLVLLGTEAQWNARALFAEQFLLSGGIRAHRYAFEEYLQQNHSHGLIILCGMDDAYSSAISSLRTPNNPSIILVTPKSDESVWGLMHNQCDRLTLLKCIHQEAT